MSLSVYQGSNVFMAKNIGMAVSSNLRRDVTNGAAKNLTFVMSFSVID